MLDFAWIKCMDIALGMGESFDLRNESTHKTVYIPLTAHATKLPNIDQALRDGLKKLITCGRLQIT